MVSSLVCLGAVITGLLQTNGQKLVVGAVPATQLVQFANTTGGAVTTHASTALTGLPAGTTLPSGFAFTFASQPGVVYTLAAPIAAATTGTLSTPFTGTPGATTMNGVENAEYLTAGGGSLTLEDSQSLPVGFAFQVNGTGTVYTLTTAVNASTSIPNSSLNTPITGLTNTQVVTLTAASTAFANYPVLGIQGGAATDASPVAVLRVTQANGEACQIKAKPWGVVLAEVNLAGVAVTPSVGSTTFTFTGGAPANYPAGMNFSFASEPTVYYQLAASVTSTAATGTLTQAYNGPAGATTINGTNPKVLVAVGGTFECVGADRQPVTFITTPAGSLVP